MPESTRRLEWPAVLVPALGTAAFGSLCALFAGAVLLVAAKLQVPDLGAGASPVTVLKTVVLVALGSLGAPVDIGRVEVSALPLGAVAFVCAGIAWAARNSLVGGGRRGPLRDSLRPALLVAVFLGVMCATAALAARIGSGPTVVAARPPIAGAAGAAWGFLSVLGAHLAGTLRASIDSLRRPRSLTAPASAGARSATLLVLLALAAVAAFGVARVLFRSGPAAGALGSLIHGLAFAPNLAAAGAALALGSRVEAGFGGLAGDGASAPGYALLDWAGGPTPVVAWVLPLAAGVCVIALGLALARRFERTPEANATRRIAESAAAALTFAMPLALLALAGDARAGVVEQEGFVRLAPDALQVLWLGLVWAAAGIVVGLLLGRWTRLGKRDSEER